MIDQKDIDYLDHRIFILENDIEDILKRIEELEKKINVVVKEVRPD